MSAGREGAVRAAEGLKPFRVSDAYIDWAHSSAAEDGDPLALELMALPVIGKGSTAYKLFELPAHVAEIADVAELYVGGRETDLRAARVRARAIAWLRQRGLSVKSALSVRGRRQNGCPPGRSRTARRP